MSVLSAIPEGMLAELQLAYATPPRAYHDCTHVREVLRHFDDVAAGPGWARPMEVALAILYHDAIYEVGRSDNEARSAEFAIGRIAHWMPGSNVDVGRVSELILLTARHGTHSPGDFPADADGEDTRRFLDCDMAILGAEPTVFDAYDRNIAAEYRGHVPGWLFRNRRRAFLKSLLGRERIYLSDFFHGRLDAAARTNLRRAITTKR